MSWLRRAGRVFRQGRLNAELDEELASHIAEAVERGRSEEEARRALGPALRHRERSRDVKLLPWLDSLAADVVFGWRQLRKRPAATAAAVVSLGLAIGATTAVFRLADAMLLRKLPVAAPERLSFLTEAYIDADGKPEWDDDFDYPTFKRYRELAGNRADLMLVGVAARKDAFLEAGAEPEKVNRQFVSGNLFGVFGLRPSLGRLLGPQDDTTPDAHPVAVLSYDFWSRRFGRDPAVLGRGFRLEGKRYEVVGVGPRDFTGTEAGEVTDVFVPSMMNAEALDKPGWSWFRIWLRPREAPAEPVRQILQADLARARAELARGMAADTARRTIESVLSHKILLRPAATGASELQRQYRRPLTILAVLVALVLLVACANLANLMAAQATARAREMALRVSIGAGRGRLIQLVLVESALLAALGSAAGALFATWAAPFVVSMLRMPQDPVRLALHNGWREMAFGVAVAGLVTALFGLAPALRAAAVHPATALKGGGDAGRRRRPLHALLAAQIAFCMVVQFVAGLFVTTFERLSRRPLGFAHERILTVDVGAPSDQTPEAWRQVAEHLRQQPGVEAVGMAGWPLLSGNRWRMAVRVRGHAVEAKSPYALDVAPGFFAAMRIGLVDGREFRRDEAAPELKMQTEPVAGVGIVNEAFARTYFGGASPVGRWVDLRKSKDATVPMRIVGLARDTVYAGLREPAQPTVYVPMGPRSRCTFNVRTAGDPRIWAGTIRRAAGEARPGLRVVNVQPEGNFVRWQSLRERLLAALSAFFAVVALVLAAVGLYGTMNYAVTGRLREIGIRMALGARAAQVVRSVAAMPFTAVGLGLAAGLAGGVASRRLVEALLFEVKSTDVSAMTAPALVLAIAGIVAAIPAAVRAARVDPARTLRGE